MPSVLGSLLRRALSARVSRTQSLGRARGSRRSEHSTQAPPDSTFSVREARAFSEVPGQRRRRKRGRSSVGRSTSKNWHRRLCVSSTGSVWCWQIRVAGCAPAAEVLVGPPARDTWHSMTHPCRDTKSHPTTLRGSPAAFFDAGLPLEIPPGKSLIVVFRDTQARVTNIANALSGLNVGVPTDREFPARAIGAVEGKLRC